MPIVKMSSASTTIKLFDNENINNETKPTLNYFERNIQPIFDEIKTTEDLILWCVIVITICVGLILNLLVIRSILRIKCNGTHYLMAQIIIIDLITLSQMKWEIFYVSNHSWLDPIVYCPVYMALDSLTSLAQIFFIIALNFHTISTYNLACKTMAKNRIQSLQQKPNDEPTVPPELLESDSEFDDDDDDDDDDEFNGEEDSICDKVVTIETMPDPKNSSNYQIARQRSIVIDYSKSKSQISVLWPIVFVWLLAISTSIPLYFYGRIIPATSRNSNERMCGLVQIDRTSNILLQILLIKMRIVVPTICLVLSTIYVIYKLMMAKRKTFDSMAMEMMTIIIDENAIQILRLALMIAITFIICSLQRMFGSLLFELISRPMMEYKYPYVHRWFGVAGCLLHYSAIIVRPFVYWRYENKLRRDLKTICCCISDRIRHRRKM